jgi:hypothetical protein
LALDSYLDSKRLKIIPEIWFSSRLTLLVNLFDHASLEPVFSFEISIKEAGK